MRSFKAFSSMILALGCALPTGCKDPPQEQKEVIRPVRYMRVISTGSGRARKFSGTSQAGITSALSFKVAGTVEKLSVKVGDKVDKGQLIAQLDPKDYELQLQQGRAALQQAKAQARVAKSSYGRVRALYEHQNATKSDLDQARAGSETANAAVSSASKSLQLVRRQKDYCQLKAPSAGAISAVSVDVNENVNPGMPIVTLSAGSAPEVTIQVPEILISGVQKGGKAKVVFDSIAGRIFDAIITEVGIAPARGATTFPVIVRLNKNEVASGDQSKYAVRPGLAAEVELEFAQVDTKERIIVPPVAIGSDHNGKFVFVLEKTEGLFGIVHRRKVEVGELTTEGIEIKTGLADSELLVTAGVSRIRDKQKVKAPALKE